MTDEKCYVFGDSNNSLTTAALLNGGNGFGGGMWSNPIWAIVFLAALRNGGIFGNDNGNGYHSQLSQIQDTLNTNQGNSLLMSAINGNATSVKELASTIGCNFNAVQGAISTVKDAICAVGNQVGMGQMQIVNSIQSGNTALANQIAQCCCDNKLLVTTQGYENRINNIEQSNMITKGFGDIAYATQSQTTALAANNDANTRAVLAKIDAVEDARKNEKIADLTAQLATVNARAERQAELAPITQKLNDIMCKQPATVTLPYSCATAVPTSLAWQAALYGGYPYANGGIFG